MAKSQDIDTLFADMMRLVASAPPRPRTKRKKPAVAAPAQITRLERALARKRPLPAVRELIPDEGNREQMIVVRAFACLLETDSAGLSMVFDRFDARERKRMRAALEAIGARQTVSAFDRISAADAAARRRIDRGRARHVAEIETKLLGYCRRNIAALAR
jgi:hypothetical protein